MTNINLIAGVDEAGRGPLAGDVFAAAVILDPNQEIIGLNDSKKLTPKKREKLSVEIKAKSLAFAIARADVAEIDNINILQASLLAMQRAVAQLAIRPGKVLVDGNQVPKINITCQAIVGGDKLEPAISAASILAKVARDAYMLQLARLYPEYHFERHKGYPTKLHLELLEQFGPAEIHRKSYGPVARLLRAQA